MKDEKKAPKLRFKGFTDDWVQRNLADLSDGFSYGLNAAAKEYDGVHGYLRITDIDEVSHSFLPEGLTSPDVPENQLTDYRMDEQSIVYARTGASTGKTYIYRDSDGELYYAGFLIRQKVNKETSAQFVYQNTLTKAWERYVQVMSQRSGQPGINAQEVGRFELAIPEKAEQDKIAHLFNSLDNLIAANQRKLAKLKELKQGYLQKMFPKNGAKVPELRFAGFADDWEERKLSDVANHRGGTSIEKYFDKEGVYKVISIGSYGLNSRYVDQNVRAISNEITDGRVVNSGELTMVLNDKTANGTIIGRTLLVEKDNEYVINQRNEIISPKENFDSNFAYTILNGPFREKVKRIAQGGTQIYVNYPAVSNLNLELPKIEEQQKIGSFFKQLDDTIALHQRKLDLLKEQKKGFLQKMFV
ncbi:restriction endonuclease subunit S [Lactobacillus delbrueckii subsp. bulgaricus]|nr:restriction endonuclease [Lactobacillus delbrueckii subsp. bulgaricus]MBT8827169.1 restriction endonuclease [Lactobacillus delbrueckii subsp. bulgaricus]